MNAVQELLIGHVRGCREAIAEAVSRVDALEALATKLGGGSLPQPVPKPVFNGWSEEEDQLIRDQYVELGPSLLARLLPHRTLGAIKTRACRKFKLVHMESRRRVRCDQCESLVSLQQVAACYSKFCAAKAAVAGGTR